MTKLIPVEPPEKDGDTCELWKTVRDLITALNNIAITPTANEQGFCFVTIADNEIQLRFDETLAKRPDARAPDSSDPNNPGNPDGNPPGGGDPGPGAGGDPGPAGGGDPTNPGNVPGNPCCTPVQAATFHEACASIVTLAIHETHCDGTFCASNMDEVYIYDSRASGVLQLYFNWNSFSFHSVGHAELHAGIWIGELPVDDLVGSAIPPGSCNQGTGTCLPPNPKKTYIVYQEDFDLTTGYRLAGKGCITPVP